MKIPKCEHLLIATALLCLLIILLWTSLRVSINSIQPHEALDRFRAPPRLLCFFMSLDAPAYRKRSEAVLDTWGKRCDKILVVVNGTRTELKDPILSLPIRHESHSKLWRKIIAALTFIHDNYLNQYDWFMKTDDDTFVRVETLKRFLWPLDPLQAAYFGHKFKAHVDQGYMSGGSGYVLSRGALRLLVEEGFAKRRPECHLEEGAVEDVELGWCLQALGVPAVDTRDSLGRPTFLPLSPRFLLSHPVPKNSWYYKYSFYHNEKPGRECCSTEAMTFHYINPDLMRFIDWLLYDLKHDR